MYRCLFSHEPHESPSALIEEVILPSITSMPEVVGGFNNFQDLQQSDATRHFSVVAHHGVPDSIDCGVVTSNVTDPTFP